MTEQAVDERTAAVLQDVRGTRDAIAVGRVFGEPWVCDGAWVIPVARIAGGGGGGGGQGTKADENGSGFGTGFGLRARPVGVYEIRDHQVAWKPALDVTALARGAQVLAGLAAVCLTLVLLRRSRGRCGR